MVTCRQSSNEAFYFCRCRSVLVKHTEVQRTDMPKCSFYQSNGSNRARNLFCPDSTPLICAAGLHSSLRYWAEPGYFTLLWTSPGADRLVQQPGLATVGQLTDAGNNLHRWWSRSWPWRQHAVRAYMGDYGLGVIITLNMIIIASGLVDTIQPFTISLLLLHGLRLSYLVHTTYATMDLVDVDYRWSI